MDKQITIRAPKAILDKWLANLRSGEIAQGRGKLYDGNGYCCLGVLMLSAGHPEKMEGCYPDSDWLDANGIQFRDAFGKRRECQPYIPAFNTVAGDANDEDGKTFPEIADAIEACAEGY